MSTEIGEYIVGAHLKLIEHCDVVDYNVRAPGGGIKGLSELDVIGLKFDSSTAFLCEVTTHILGALYGANYTDTLEKISRKHRNQLGYAEQYLTAFKSKRFMFWSPVVTSKSLISGLEKLEPLELIINSKYTDCVRQLQVLAKKETYPSGNVFFRTLQVLEHLRQK